MRALAVVAILVVAGTATADKRLTDMRPGYEREAQTCTTQISGLEKVATGGAALAPSLGPDDKAALDKDLAALATGLSSVKTYCTEVTDLVAFLTANAAVSYKSVERELDARDNKVRKLRKESKKMIDALQPITRTWIGKIAQAQTQKPAVIDTSTPGTFPSGRTIALPPLGGTWKLSGTPTTDTAEYAEKTWTATLYAKPFSAATCEQQAKTRIADSTLSEASQLPGVAEGLDTAWHAATAPEPATKRYVEAICVRGAAGGWLGTLELKPKWNANANTLRALLVRMLVAQAARKTP